MRPYYQDDLVTLYHGDCREIREWIRTAGLLAMDPPYGIAWKKGNNRKAKSRAHDGIQNDGDTSYRDWVLREWGTTGDSRPALVFGSFAAPMPPGVKHHLVWEKPNDAGVVGSTTGYRRDVEVIFLIGYWPKREAQWGSVIRSAQRSVGNPYAPAARFNHPHAKPVDIMCQLIERAPHGIVADPFAGSGSTLVAAKMLGRQAIGVELEERHCETAALRLSQSVLDLGGAA